MLLAVFRAGCTSTGALPQASSRQQARSAPASCQHCLLAVQLRVACWPLLSVNALPAMQPAASCTSFAAGPHPAAMHTQVQQNADGKATTSDAGTEGGPASLPLTCKSKLCRLLPVLRRRWRPVRCWGSPSPLPLPPGAPPCSPLVLPMATLAAAAAARAVLDERRRARRLLPPPSSAALSAAAVAEAVPLRVAIALAATAGSSSQLASRMASIVDCSERPVRCAIERREPPMPPSLLSPPSERA
jgi:hypothetical protein